MEFWSNDGDLKIDALRVFDSILSSPHKLFIDNLLGQYLGRSFALNLSSSSFPPLFLSIYFLSSHHVSFRFTSFLLFIFYCGRWDHRLTRLTADTINLLPSMSRLEIRSNFFSQRVVNMWNSLPGDPWKNYMNGKNNDEKIKLKQITVNHLYLIHNISLQDLYKCMSNLPISRDKDSAINLCELSTITFSNSTNWLINCLLFNIWSIV